MIMKARGYNIRYDQKEKECEPNAVIWGEKTVYLKTITNVQIRDANVSTPIRVLLSAYKN